MKSRYICVLAVLLAASAQSFAQQPSKLPVPDQQAQGTALELVKEVYKGDYEKARTDEQKVALGDRIFHDPRLSKDDTLSCASCHALDKGGTDQERYSTGVGGKKGDINSPTVFNSGFHFVQFWDGRAKDLEEQADGPVNNPIEMASNWPEVIGKLAKDEEFVAAFTAVYPAGLEKDSFLDAIATFERSLITPNSRFDKFLKGDADALTPAEKQGYELFKSFSCATCHVGKNIGGRTFEEMGRAEDYFKARGDVIKPDHGRFNVTKEDGDLHRFKVPTLRNIAVTWPYFHDGTVVNLADAVRTMARVQVGKKITDDEVAKILAFLNALTGEYRGKLLE
jgi:cytochrome c peroxidase